jgi:hypothetical protein
MCMAVVGLFHSIVFLTTSTSAEGTAGDEGVEVPSVKLVRSSD